MPRAYRHQPLAHITPGTDVHAQPVSCMLMHEGPIRARKHASLGFAHGDRVARAVGARVENHLPMIGGQMPC